MPFIQSYFNDDNEDGWWEIEEMQAPLNTEILPENLELEEDVDPEQHNRDLYRLLRIKTQHLDSQEHASQIEIQFYREEVTEMKTKLRKLNEAKMIRE